MVWYDFYAALEVSRYASTEEIKKAYRAGSRLKHPDKGPQNAADLAANTAAFQILNEAHHVLTDKNKRQVYDTTYDTQRRNARSANASSSSSSQPKKAAQTQEQQSFESNLGTMSQLKIEHARHVAKARDLDLRWYARKTKHEVTIDNLREVIEDLGPDFNTGEQNKLKIKYLREEILAEKDLLKRSTRRHEEDLAAVQKSIRAVQEQMQDLQAQIDKLNKDKEAKAQAKKTADEKAAKKAKEEADRASAFKAAEAAHNRPEPASSYFTSEQSYPRTGPPKEVVDLTDEVPSYHSDRARTPPSAFESKKRPYQKTHAEDDGATGSPPKKAKVDKDEPQPPSPERFYRERKARPYFMGVPGVQLPADTEGMESDEDEWEALKIETEKARQVKIEKDLETAALEKEKGMGKEKETETEAEKEKEGEKEGEKEAEKEAETGKEEEREVEEKAEKGTEAEAENDEEKENKSPAREEETPQTEEHNSPATENKEEQNEAKTEEDSEEISEADSKEDFKEDSKEDFKEDPKDDPEEDPTDDPEEDLSEISEEE